MEDLYIIHALVSVVFSFQYAFKMLALVSKHIDGVWEAVDRQDSLR